MGQRMSGSGSGSGSENKEERKGLSPLSCDIDKIGGDGFFPRKENTTVTVVTIVTT
jgi:hypothetical protein